MDTLQKILCPSILNLSTDNMREEIEKLDATDMDIYHVDIMDGTFVPNFGMSVRELEMIRRITDAGHHKLVDCHDGHEPAPLHQEDRRSRCRHHLHSS